MTADDLARRLDVSTATAKRQLAEWEALQATDPTVPRVTRVRSGGRGRPAFHVEGAEVERWLLGLPVVTLAQAA
jgi:predicted ArsR family transcriptional regulator